MTRPFLPLVRLLVPIVGMTGIVLGALGLVQAYVEREHMRDDLERRARVLARALLPQAERISAQLAWFAAGLAMLGLVLTVTTATGVRTVFERPPRGSPNGCAKCGW